MAGHDPDQDGQDRNVEVPGDTDSADIVGPTGEQMPEKSHDGIGDTDRPHLTDDAREADEELDGHPV